MKRLAVIDGLRVRKVARKKLVSSSDNHGLSAKPTVSESILAPVITIPERTRE